MDDQLMLNELISQGQRPVTATEEDSAATWSFNDTLRTIFLPSLLCAPTPMRPNHKKSPFLSSAVGPFLPHARLGLTSFILPSYQALSPRLSDTTSLQCHFLNTWALAAEHTSRVVLAIDKLHNGAFAFRYICSGIQKCLNPFL